MKPSVLIAPIITEKSMAAAAKNIFTFAVAKLADKTAIASEIAQAFSVKVLAVKTTTVKGKTRRAGRTRQQIQTSPWKKALVTLAKGQKINLFDVSENAAKT